VKLTEIIQDANKTGNIIIGYNKCKKFIKVNEARLVVVANNAPARIRNEMEHNARIAGINFEVFAGTSRELGVLCGKPYPASVLVIK
jgi:large subunit ribosomal protein L30e